MIQAFYTSAVGMAAQQSNMDVISNNISNINTPGYRIRRAEFADLIHAVSGGYGVKVENISVMPFPDEINPLKTAITGQGGYFMIEDNNGVRGYTTAGDFKLLERNGTFYLGTHNGDFVLDENFNRIEMTSNAADAVIYNGVIYPDGNTAGEGKVIAVVRFMNSDALTVSGERKFSESVSSGPPILHENARAVSDYYEDMSLLVAERQMGETIKIIQAQMAYSFNSKALQTADEMAAMANHLRY